MRLICPNCDAQYEVPDNVMPPNGRDVQCSNCGHTWFQNHPDAEEADLVAETAAPEGDAEQDPGPTASTDDAPPDPVPDEAPSDEDTPPEEDTEAPSMPTRRPLDPAVADVLREEAAREADARKRDAAALESQPDLGLDAASSPAQPAATDEPRPITPAVATATATAAGDRRARLPDIEQINSTLRSNSARSPAEDPGQTGQVEAREKRRFGAGFLTVLGLAAVLTLAYVFAPELAEVLPQSDPWLSSYVSLVDTGRMWLDRQVAATLTQLDTITGNRTP
ncbi:zinc-ribbon domain-containing protein [uncultured Roseobacter sp.]|uniref:zinc-ribbon domain-containing protein n=1 Tax=uncultured Roseobacter sp. TaxID=114847 RepID=UPI0026084086|nr:zinc-ribbon domain-containing protein [uncultured Roseobacter sp.]